MSTEIELSPAEVQPVGKAPEHSDALRALRRIITELDAERASLVEAGDLDNLANGLATAGAAGFIVSIMAAEGSMILAAIASGLALASIMAARFLWAEIEAITGRNDLTRPEVEK